MWDGGYDPAKPMDGESPTPRGSLPGLLLITLASLSLEVVLTRILSVTTWYHFAFLAVSLAMSGLALGALRVHLQPGRFPAAAVPAACARHSLAFAATAVAALGLHQVLPMQADWGAAAWSTAAITVLALTLPFYCAGVVACLVMTRFPRQSGQLYSADLVGAAAGAVLPLVLLPLSDPFSVVLVTSATAAAAACCFQRRRRYSASAAVLLLLAVVQGSSAVIQKPLLRLRHAHGEAEQEPLWERWNSYSRVTVYGDPERPTPPFGWGFSPHTPAYPIRQLALTIDSGAATWLTHWTGESEELEFLRYDVTQIGHSLRANARVAVVGAGGGRDLLAAKIFGQRHVTGIEINPLVLEAAHNVYGDFTGHLNRDPAITLIQEDGRKWMQRRANRGALEAEDRFDLVQLSLIDTFAATAAGAFSLTENPLYTVEAWQAFLDNLDTGGILSVSHWYFAQRPAEMYRLTALAAATLLERGIDNPRLHLLLARMQPDDPAFTDGVGTLLLSATPFTDADLARFEGRCQELGFDVVLSPRQASDVQFAELLSPQAPAFRAAYPLDLSPPRDRRPFFFHLLKLRDFWRGEFRQQGNMTLNQDAVMLLSLLLVVSCSLALGYLLLPLCWRSFRRRFAAAAGARRLSLHFAALGAGFMLAEIGMLQEIGFRLGNPTQAMAVTLVGMLLGAAWASRNSHRPSRQRLLAPPLLLLLAWILDLRRSADLGRPSSWLASLDHYLMVFVCGWVLGSFLPRALRAAHRQAPQLLPWFWGLNGAFSVLAGAVALPLSLSLGLPALLPAAAACYVLALWSTPAGDGVGADRVMGEGVMGGRGDGGGSRGGG